MGQNTKFSEMLVTRKVSKTKFHQMIKSKTKVKHTLENANRKQGPYFTIRKKRKRKRNSRPKAHRIRTAA